MAGEGEGVNEDEFEVSAWDDWDIGVQLVEIRSMGGWSALRDQMLNLILDIQSLNGKWNIFLHENFCFLGGVYLICEIKKIQ